MLFLLFALLTFASTLIGGLISLRYKDKLHKILAFTAGVILAVVAFDLFPEMVDLAQKTNTPFRIPMIAFVIGFLVFHLLEKLVLIHHAQEGSYEKHRHPTVGMLSAVALILHSFLDGVGIGLGFQISPALGVFVGLAVIAHDFSDGLNTGSLMLLHGNSSKKALKFVILDAAAPVLGAVSTLFFHLPQQLLLLYLGSFAGLLLYLGTSDILPEAHSKDSSIKTILMTLFGVLFVYLFTLVM